jgi:serine O-acetyltransferase
MNGDREQERSIAGQVRKMIAEIRADHDAIMRAEEKYRARERPSSVFMDMVQKIGFQMMVSYRVMRLYDALGWTFFAKVASRRIRRVYGAEIHWRARLDPGVMIVHGTGLVISHAARIGPGCILFQHVTLGESIHPETREIGAPTLEADVHVGAGATLVGPITIGHGTKIMAGAVVLRSVPPMSLVETAPVSVHPRQLHARGDSHRLSS